MEEQIEKIKKELKEKEIQNIYLNFVDLTGNILTKMVGVQELINNTHVSWFDGISINGRLIEDFSDKKSNDWLVILPDPFSFRVIPFLKEENQKSAVIFCSIKNNYIDTRGLLKQAVHEFEELEMTPMFGTQFIYSINQSKNDNQEIKESQDFYKLLATNKNTIFQNNLVNEVLKSGIDIEYYMPYGKEHNRIDLVPDVADISADKLWTTKWFAQNLAHQKEMKISLKNMKNINLSSCPVHMSLWRGKREKNLFFDGDDKFELSQLAKNFMNGILYHQKSIKALATITSKEPQKYYQTKISVNRGNSLLQVPLYFNEKQKQDRVGWSKRCIYNGLNADQNYYLMFAVLLYAGLYGVQNKLGGIEKIEVDSYTKEELISDLEHNDYFKEKLGEKLIQKAINKLKKGE